MNLSSLFAKNNQQDPTLSLALEIDRSQIERMIERARDRRKRSDFLDTSAWTTNPERPRLEHCTSDPSKIIQVFECLGVDPQAGIGEINSAFKSARALLDPGLLTQAQAPEQIRKDAAKAFECIEVAYRLLSSPYIREHFVSILQERAVTRKLRWGLEAAGKILAGMRKQKPQFCDKDDLKSKIATLLANDREKKANKDKLPGGKNSAGYLVEIVKWCQQVKDKLKIAPRPQKTVLELPAKQIEKQKENQSNAHKPVPRSWSGFASRLAIMAAIIGAAAFGYKKNKKQIDSVIDNNQITHKFTDTIQQAGHWWSKSAEKKITSQASKQTIKFLNQVFGQ